MVGVGKEKKSTKNLQKSKHKNNKIFLESLLSESFPSLGVTVHLASLGYPPTLCRSLDLLWGQLRFESVSIPLCSCLQCLQLSDLVHFILWELSMTFYIFYRQRVCLVDHVDLIWSLYSWWEGFGSSSLSTLPLGFNSGLISTSACGSSTGVCAEAALKDLGLPLWGPGVELVQLLGSQGFWQHQALRGVGCWGSISCSRRVWQLVLANTLQYSCLGNLLPDREAWQARVYRTVKSRTWPKWLCAHRCIGARLFLPVAALPQWEMTVKVAQLLGLWGLWRCQVCRDTDCLHRRSYGPIRVFFWVSCSWPSEGLFGPSVSVAPPVQALRGLPNLGSSSVDWCNRHLKEHPGWGPTVWFRASGGPASLLFSCWCWYGGGGRDYGDGSTPTRDSAVSPCFHGCLAFLHAFLTIISSLASPGSIYPQSRASLALGLLHNPLIPAPSHAPSRVPTSCSKDCLILIPFRLPQISFLTLSLKCFSSNPDNCPDVGIGPLLQFPHLLRACPVLLTLLFFPQIPSSY